MRTWIAAPRAGRRRLGQRLARRQPHHPLDQVDPGHLLGDAVLDLQARVHLQEVEARRRVGVDDELDRARRAVGRRRRPGAPPRRPARRASRRTARAPASPRSPSGCGAAASSRARPSASTRPRPSPKICTSTWRARLDVLLEVAARLLEVGLRQPRDRLEGLAELAAVGAAAHADAAAAGRALQHHRVADPLAARRACAMPVSRPGARQQRQPRPWSPARAPCA